MGTPGALPPTLCPDHGPQAPRNSGRKAASKEKSGTEGKEQDPLLGWDEGNGVGMGGKGLGWEKIFGIGEGYWDAGKYAVVWGRLLGCRGRCWDGGGGTDSWKDAGMYGRVLGCKDGVKGSWEYWGAEKDEELQLEEGVA